MFKLKYAVSLVAAMALSAALYAQNQTDTLTLKFQDAEKRFLVNNFSLIAQRYNVDASKALIQQARLWDNPALSTDQNLYSRDLGFFNHSNGNGQLFAQISQVFLTAGKRGKQIKVAQDDASIQQAQFNDLLRNLRYNMQVDFAQLHNLIEQNRIFQYEIASSNNLVKAISTQYSVGNSSLRDVVRLQAVAFGLENDLVENVRQINELENDLKTLLVVKETTFIVPDISTPTTNPVSLNINALIDTARANRGDYQASKFALAQAGHNLSYQKALAVPDISVGVDYDRASNYVPNYYGLAISLPLPFFNRNQGNIKSAKFNIQNQENVLKNSDLQVRNDVVTAVEQYNLSLQLFSKNNLEFYNTYDKLFGNVVQAYRSRQMGLVEFVDFFESYKDTKLKVIQQEYNLQKAIADLNFNVGSTVINP
ncbi:TolC family protein [uncultured Mucilaginibacter sp.]|uniref:TolC family protein n=1 Tax=uncultured Mucilaginibacter sp. TaxID=797541 RepID=UPI0026386CE5|nr:TolC family protein [uncultured Mucilaginibacter sp.]